jgi:hypothetical protein
MAYTTIAKVRNIFGFSENDASDAVISEFITYADKEVDLKTGTTWAGTETYYLVIQEVSALFVGSLVYKRFRDQQETSRELWKEGEAKLEEIMIEVDGVPFMAFEDSLT